MKLSATQCYLPSDIEDSVMRRLERNARNVPVTKLGIDFAGQFIAISSPDEVHLACLLACAYHNSLVRENFSDAAYGPYETVDIDCPVTSNKTSDLTSGVTSSEMNIGHWEAVSENCRRRPRYKYLNAKVRGKNGDITDEIVDGLSEWDSEVRGERVVYDATYEMNEDLVPWMMERNSDWAVEKFGYYT